MILTHFHHFLWSHFHFLFLISQAAGTRVSPRTSESSPSRGRLPRQRQVLKYLCSGSQLSLHLMRFPMTWGGGGWEKESKTGGKKRRYNKHKEPCHSLIIHQTIATILYRGGIIRQADTIEMLKDYDVVLHKSLYLSLSRTLDR